MSVVFDASALLAWLRREPGAERVEAELRGGRIAAVNWSETLQKAAQFGLDHMLVAGRFRHAGVEVEPVLGSDGERAADLWTSAPGLSLADRLCLAVGWRLGVPVLTADRRWAELEDATGVPIELIR